MITRLYVHNYRCLINFELHLHELSSALLLGKNGTGKSTVADVLIIFQAIAQGRNRVGELVDSEDASQGNLTIPIHLELEALLNEQKYHYHLVLEFPAGFHEYRVAKEWLRVDGLFVYERNQAEVMLYRENDYQAQFLVDWHLVALPVIQGHSALDPLRVFRDWLAKMIILSPCPGQMTGESRGKTLYPKRDARNFAEWFSGLLHDYPSSYTEMDRYLKLMIPDLQEFQNPSVGKNANSILVRFARDTGSLDMDFTRLSDGEKMFFLCALTLAAAKTRTPIFCFWDEPDNFISLSEANQLILALRRGFQAGNQLLITSHNSEAIRGFSDHNTFVLARNTHLAPVTVKILEQIEYSGDLIENIIMDELGDE